ncbi:MAG: TRL-like family protein [Bacteriovoracaceae bacterium]|nr:TRL-like family protein [Bacteriovoracaceae bacterium]
MKKILTLVIFVLFLSGCTVVQTPINGMLFVESKGPSEVVTDGKIATKKGEACSIGIFGVVRGDSSISTAARNGKIKKITHVDHRVKNILHIYGEYCTIVYGR